MTTTTYDRDESLVLRIETAGSLAEAGAGIAVIVLAIVALTHFDSTFLAGVTAIVLGGALIAQGGAVAAEYSNLLAMVTGGSLGAVELGGGMTVELLGGVGIIVLGILALLGLVPDVLLASGVIAVGAATILAASGLERLNTLKTTAAGLAGVAKRVVEGSTAGAIMAQALAGGAAIVLGIIALAMPVYAGVLVLAALLVLGATVTLSGTALTGRMIPRLFGGQRAA